MKTLTVNQVCRFLGVSNDTVYRLISAGHLSSFRVGWQHRIPEAEFETFIQKNSPRARRRQSDRIRVAREK